MINVPFSVVSVDDSCNDCPVGDKGVCLRYGESLRKAISQFSVDALILKGSTLAYSGDIAKALFIIKMGQIKAFKSLPDGRQQIVGFGSPGDVIGNPQRQTSFDCTFEALTDSVLCKTRYSDLAIISDRFPEFTKSFMDAVANEIRRRGDQTVLLGRKNAEERLAAFILERHSAMQDIDDTGLYERGMVLLHMTRRDIADYLGLTIETVSRVLTSFRNRRLIALLNKNHFEILEYEALMTLAGGDADRESVTRIFL
ncbi:MAG: Crp/Fnr family transcriptional regulator [Parvularculaceae bacterium]